MMPAPSTGTITCRKPSRARRSQAANTALCSNAVVTTVRAPDWSRRARAAPFTARLSGLGTATGEHDLRGLDPEEPGEVLPRLLEGRFRRPSGGVTPGRIAKRIGEERGHGLDRGRPHGRRRRVVEVHRPFSPFPSDERGRDAPGAPGREPTTDTRLR